MISAINTFDKSIISGTQVFLFVICIGDLNGKNKNAIRYKWGGRKTIQPRVLTH